MNLGKKLVFGSGEMVYILFKGGVGNDLGGKIGFWVWKKYRIFISNLYIFFFSKKWYQ